MVATLSPPAIVERVRISAVAESGLVQSIARDSDVIRQWSAFRRSDNREVAISGLLGGVGGLAVVGLAMTFFIATTPV